MRFLGFSFSLLSPSGNGFPNQASKIRKKSLTPPRAKVDLEKKIKVVCTHSISGGIDSTLIEGWVQEKSIR